jgi:heme exporter protein B
MFGAMTVRTKARDLVLSVVLLPLLSPVLLTAVSATRGLVMDPQDFAMAGHLRLLGIFDVTFLAGGLSLFGLLIED